MSNWAANQANAGHFDEAQAIVARALRRFPDDPKLKEISDYLKSR
jgi:hypothetical protein